METNAAKRVNKIYKVLLILLIVSMSFTGCMLTNTSEGLESGFAFSSLGGESCESNPFHCGYKTDRTEFDIDDVTIDLYYGVDCCNDDGLLCGGGSIPEFYIYVTPRGIDNKYLIKHVEEELVSVKYDCKIIRREFLFWRTTEIIYNHHETINIPKELLVNPSGCIEIVICDIDNESDIYPIEQKILQTRFYYTLVDGKVVLSSEEIK